MRPGQNNRRGRNRNNNRRSNLPNRNQTYDSNGPDVRVRGTAHQVLEKYQALARDASSAGDPVVTESYLQHAEHYQRIINEVNDAYNKMQQDQERQREERRHQTGQNGEAGDDNDRDFNDGDRADTGEVGRANGHFDEDGDENALPGFISAEPRNGDDAPKRGRGRGRGRPRKAETSDDDAIASLPVDGEAGQEARDLLDGVSDEGEAPAPRRATRRGPRRRNGDDLADNGVGEIG